MLKFISYLTAVVIIAASVISVTGPAQAMDTLDKGPKIGSTIPQILETSDQHSKVQSFKSLKGQRGLVLIFTRSFDWWPYCKSQAVAWNKHLKDVKALGYGLATVSYDRVKGLKKFSNRRNIGFPLLSDPKSIIIKAFDLHHGGYAHPMILIIDTEGKIIKRFSASHYSERPSVDNVLKSLASNK